MSLSQAICETFLSQTVRVIHDEREYEAFLIRSDFVVCFGTNLLHQEHKILEFYHVEATDDPLVYRYKGGIRWINAFPQVRLDVLLNQLPHFLVGNILDEEKFQEMLRD